MHIFTLTLLKPARLKRVQLTGLRLTRVRLTCVRNVLFALMLIVSFFHSVSFAQQIERGTNRFVGTLYVRPSIVDNGAGAAEGGVTGETRETQTEYGAGVSGNWVSELTALALDYELTETRFSEQTQPDDTFLDGNSRFSLGNNATNYGLSVEHSSRRILASPAASPILLANTEEREIFILSPLLRANLSSAQDATLVFNYSKVDFEGSTSNDSQARGVDLYLNRHVSPIRELSLIVGQREIDYEDNDLADYETQTLAARLRTEHRWFDYFIEFGLAKIDPKVGESVTETTLDFNLNSRLVGNIFSLFLMRNVSNSSQGNGNADFFSTEVSFDGAALTDQDQIIRTSGGLSWAYDLLCTRCGLVVSSGFERADYLNLTINDSRQVFLGVNFRYQFSSALELALSTRASETTFPNGGATQFDTESIVRRIGLTYKLNRSLEFEFQHDSDERETDGGGLGRTVVNTTSLSATLLLR